MVRAEFDREGATGLQDREHAASDKCATKCRG